jgi:hypothetical protein
MITRRGAVAGLALPASMAASSAVAGESADLTPRLAMLKRFVGSWRGAGDGEPGVSEVTRTYEPALGGQFLLARNRSAYAPQPKNPKGEIHDDMGLYSFDRAARAVVFRQFHLEGFVSTYSAPADSLAGDTLVFLSTAIENVPAGFRGRETFVFTGADALEERFEIAEPGKDFTLYSHNRLKRA